MLNIQQKVAELYAHNSSAYALFYKDEDAAIQLLWQNEPAKTLLNKTDYFTQPLFKLEVMDCFAKQATHVFDYSFSPSLKQFQFVATPFDESNVLVNFFHKPTSSFQPSLELSEALFHHSSEKDSDGVYQSLIASAKLGAINWNIQADSIEYDERALRVFGINKTSLGQSYQDFLNAIFADDKAKVSDAFEEHLSADWPLSIEFRMVGDNGTHYWVLLRGQAQWSSDNSPIRLLASVEDISERKHTEFELRQRESLIEQMIDALPLSINLKDAQGCYRFFNTEAEQQKGMDRKGLIGRTDFEVYPKEIAEQKAKEDRQVYESNELLITEQQNDEGPGWLLIGKIPINILLPNRFTQTWILSFSLDISERKQMEDALKRANQIAEEAAQSKANFLSVMSHEIRTPLNSVIGNAGLLLHENLDASSAEHVEMIKRSGEHLLYLINDILDFNKLEAGKVELINKPFNLKKQLQTVLDMSVTNAKVKNISLQAEIADDIHTAYLGDEGRLRQILLNLIGNAIKFTDQGGVTVKLYSQNDSQKLRFEVIDTGIGISQANISKLFSEFSQAEASTASKYGGSGLGLAICKKLVEAMGGSIGITSKIGEGSTFWFEIPSQPTDEQLLLDTQEENETDIENLSILVAEDNLPNQFLIKSILTKLGHSVVIANNGKEAVEALDTEDVTYDLVLMDMQMPEMSGLEATRLIRKSDNDIVQQIPIIALTANAYNEAYESVMEAGMNDCLTKPIILNDLKKALNYWGSLEQAS